MNEFWLPVVGFEHRYIVSTKGRVKRLFGRFGPGLLKANKNWRYQRVNLSNNGPGKVGRDIHRLVAEAFLGVHPGLVVNHKDGDRFNNNLENLEWVTQRENVLHSVKAGRTATMAHRENGRFAKVGN